MREIEFRALLEYPDGKREWGYYKPLFMPAWMAFEDVAIIEKDLQYIGLHDKNGKKIFEGDICSGLKHSKTKKKLFIVEDIRNVYAMQGVDWNNVEVVGNIYENPDLGGRSKR